MLSSPSLSHFVINNTTVLLIRISACFSAPQSCMWVISPLAHCEHQDEPSRRGFEKGGEGLDYDY